MDGNQPLVVTSQHTVANTITAPDDYLSLLQPSEPGATLFETNTYFNTMTFTKTLTDSDVSKVVSTTDVIQQVVITELLPSKRTSIMTSYIAIDANGNQSPALKSDILKSPLLSATDVVKTLYVTYTYFNTYLVNGSTIVRTNVSTSSEMITEKLYVYPTKRVEGQSTVSMSETLINSNADYLSASEIHRNKENDLMDESLKQTINIYATKSFMTTFTFFTTFLQGPDGGDDSNTHETLRSTVVNSHTSVLANVVTESIPINFLPSSDITKLRNVFFGERSTDLLNDDNKYTTVATLIGGPAIEITAVKSNIDPTSALSGHVNSAVLSEQTADEESVNIHNSENEIEKSTEVLNSVNSIYVSDSDQEQAASNDLEASESVLTPDSTNPDDKVNLRPNIRTNSTKVNKNTQSPVSNLIGSLNLNGLKVLRPMFDAVAGLINTNFGLKRQNDTVNHSFAIAQTTLRSPTTLATEFTHNYGKNISESGITITPESLLNIEFPNLEARNPIYIPVNGNKNNAESSANPYAEALTLNSFSTNTDFKSDQNNEVFQRDTQFKKKIPLINGGIPISPGEVITANSDVILGRPTGNRPRIPLNNKLYDTPQQLPGPGLPPLSPRPPGIPPMELYSDSHSAPSVHGESYIGPPPPPPQLKSLKTVKQHLHTNQIVQSKPGVRLHSFPLQSTQQFGPSPPSLHQLPPHMNRQNAPPHIAPQHIVPHINKPNAGHVGIRSHIPLGPVGSQQPPLQILPPHQHLQHKPHNKDHYHLSRPNIIPIKHAAFNKRPQPGLYTPAPPNNALPSDAMHQYIVNSVTKDNNNIIEIQRIPEVFSTDLPPVHIYNSPQQIISLAPSIEPSQTSYSQEIQTSNQLPEVVESATGQPLFVNIQPSQIAKVVIPHGSSSALIYGGVQEMHKSGEYFDEPQAYPNEKDQIAHITDQLKSTDEQNKNLNFIEDSNASGSNGNLIYIKSHTPILSNQQINVDSHILSQDVNVHAPPIIFNGQETNSNDAPLITFESSIGDNNDKNRDNQLLTYNPNYNVEYPQPIANQQYNRSHFTVDIQSINLGMQPEDDENVSKEELDDPSDHLQGADLSEQVIDQHKEDDFENEQGEVIQESNAVPQLVSSSQSLTDANSYRIASHEKYPTKNEKDPKIPFTQTEANSLWKQYVTTTTMHTPISDERNTLNQLPLQILPPKPASTRPQLQPTHNSNVQIPNIPQIHPSVINDMYPMHYRNQSIQESPNVNQVRLHHKPPFVGPQLNERPNIKVHQHLVPLQNLRPPPHFPPPIFDDGRRPPKPVPPISVSLTKSPSLGKDSIANDNYRYRIPTTRNHTNIHQSYTTYRPPEKSHDSSEFGIKRPYAEPSTTAKPTSDQSAPNAFPPLSNGNEAITHAGSPFYLVLNSSSTTSTTKNPNVNNMFNPSLGKPFASQPNSYKNPQENSPQSDKYAPMNLNTGEIKMSTIDQKQTQNEQTSLDSEHSSHEPDLVRAGSEKFNITDNIASHSSTENYSSVNRKPVQNNSDLNPVTPQVDSFLKTPSVDMQPPPILTDNLKSHQGDHVFSSPTDNRFYNVLVEEVMGLQPPPLQPQQHKPKEGNASPSRVIKPTESHAYFTIRPNSANKKHPQTFTEHSIITSNPQPSKTVHNIRLRPTPVVEHPKKSIVRERVNNTRISSVSLKDGNRYESPRKPNNREQPTYSFMPGLPPIPNSDEILILGSEKPLTEKPSSNINTHPLTQSTSTISSMDDATMGLVEPIYKFHRESTPIRFSSEMSKPAQSSIGTTSTTIVNTIEPTPSIILENVTPTKYITSTKTLTVTTTKATVIRSQGSTTTLTLTLTKTQTSTVVDTITHTLLKPTHVTKEPVIKPTIYTAPVSPQSGFGSVSSVFASPSFSIYTEYIGDSDDFDHNNSNVSSERDETTEKVSLPPHVQIKPTSRKPSVTANNDSIFVVMTDQNKLGGINLEADVLHKLQNTLMNTTGSEPTQWLEKKPTYTHVESPQDDLTHLDDADDDNFPKRDEDDVSNDVSHVLLGGILIAAPPRSSDVVNKNKKRVHNQNSQFDINLEEELDQHLENHFDNVQQDSQANEKRTNKLSCEPTCNGLSNEMCQIIGDQSKCICRPGFARMFPDRPCKRKSLTLLRCQTVMHSI